MVINLSVLGLYIIIFGFIFLIYNFVNDKKYESASNKRSAAIKLFTDKWCDQELEADLLSSVEDDSKYCDIYTRIESYKENNGALYLYSMEQFKNNIRLSPWYHVGKYRLQNNKKNVQVIKGLLMETYGKIPYMDAIYMCVPGYVAGSSPNYIHAPSNETIESWVDNPPWLKI